MTIEASVRPYIGKALAIKSGNIELYLKSEDAYLSLEGNGYFLFFTGGNMKVNEAEFHSLKEFFNTEQ